MQNTVTKLCIYSHLAAAQHSKHAWARTVVGQKSHITDHALHWIFHLCKLTEFNNLSDDAYQLHCMEA